MLSHPQTTSKRFILTSFGPFHGISSNPTATLLHGTESTLPLEEQGLLNYLILHPILASSGTGTIDQPEVHVHQLPVSLDSSNALDELYNQYTSSYNDKPTKTVFVHLGVDGTQLQNGTFKIERKAFNECDFRVPDNSENMPLKEKIDSEKELTFQLFSLSSYDKDNNDEGESESSGVRCMVDVLCIKLKEEYKYDDVNVSEDAGRFVCNYVLYHSLMKCEQTNRSQQTTNQKLEAVFVHVPKFTLINESLQIGFVRDFLTVLYHEISQ